MALRCSWINQNGMQCGMPLNHACNHGNGLLTTPRDVWHEPMSDLPTNETPLKMVEKFGNVFTDKSTIKQCLWSGAHGRCIYELGHTLPHKEKLDQ